MNAKLDKLKRTMEKKDADLSSFLTTILPTKEYNDAWDNKFLILMDRFFKSFNEYHDYDSKVFYGRNR